MAGYLAGGIIGASITILGDIESAGLIIASVATSYSRSDDSGESGGASCRCPGAQRMPERLTGSGCRAEQHRARRAGDLTRPADGHTRAFRHADRSAHAHPRSEEHTSELQSRENLVCRLLL